jgi:hypothetical protein
MIFGILISLNRGPVRWQVSVVTRLGALDSPIEPRIPGNPIVRTPQWARGGSEAAAGEGR